MTIDINRARGLLHIVDLAKNWPRLRGLHDSAMKELEAMSKDFEEGLKEAEADRIAREAHEKAVAKAEAEAPTQGEFVPEVRSDEAEKANAEAHVERRV